MRRKQGNAAQLKEQNKSPETDPKGNEYEPPDKKLKITVTNMFYELRKTIMNKMRISIKRKHFKKWKV